MREMVGIGFYKGVNLDTRWTTVFIQIIQGGALQNHTWRESLSFKKQMLAWILIQVTEWIWGDGG